MMNFFIPYLDLIGRVVFPSGFLVFSGKNRRREPYYLYGAVQDTSAVYDNFIKKNGSQSRKKRKIANPEP